MAFLSLTELQSWIRLRRHLLNGLPKVDFCNQSVRTAVVSEIYPTFELSIIEGLG